MDKIAIIGIACLFPDAPTPAAFWRNLLAERDSTSRATDQDFEVEVDRFYDPAKGVQDKYYCVQGGFIRDFVFDATGYRLPAEQLAGYDDLTRWSLYVARTALADSHYGDAPALARCGLILGSLSLPTRSSRRQFAPLYHQALEPPLQTLLGDPRLHLATAPGPDPRPDDTLLAGYPAAVVAAALGLGGPRLMLDAACASPIYALKVASLYLQAGHADLMLAGGVSRADPVMIQMGFSMFQAYPHAQGASRPLDRSSQGMLSGQGAGMFVLKRYRDALRDGDPIYATIAGIGLSNDGRGKHILSPQARGQILALERAYRAADLSPASVPYVECHATGTPVGDSTELDALRTFFGSAGAAPYLGAAKSNCGHLLTAAGMVGMTKTILGMAAGVIPPTIHVTDPLDTPAGQAAESRVVRQAIPWPETGSVRRGGVNGFGFGGTNAHIILERGPVADPASAVAPPVPLAIVGMAAHFGPCADLAAFEQAIYNGTPQFIPLPPTRWRGLEQAADRVYGLTPPLGAYLESFEFDFLHFRSPPGGGDQPIPQQLLVLQVADQALRDAGLAAGGNVAVLVAMGTELALHPFLGRVDAVGQIRAALAAAGIMLTPDELAALEWRARESLHEPSPVNQSTSFIGNIMASRIAAQWDFTGPAFTVSAEENSAFRALELAQILLTTGEVEAVVVGAVDLAGGIEEVLVRRQFGLAESAAPTLSFDQQMRGALVGEGAGAVVLKRYDPAQPTPDRIYAVIDAVACVQPAAVPGAVPGATWDGAAMIAAMRQGRAVAGTSAAPPDYLEVCGSGIAAQDSAEVAGLLAAYGPSAAPPTCALGSVKALVGHTGAAAGMASLIKTALCLYHRYIPATPGWHGPKTPEQWQDSPFYVPGESRPWFAAAGQARRAAVNGLSADGSYAHLLLSDAPALTPRPARLAGAGCRLLPLVGADKATLDTALDTLEHALTGGAALHTLAPAYLAAVAQAPAAVRVLSLVGHTPAELLQEIAQARNGLAAAWTRDVPWQTPRGSYFTAHPLGPAGSVAFVYPGGFTAYPGMGRDLLRHFPALHERLGQLVGDVGEAFAETAIYPRRLAPTDSAANLPAPVAMLESGMALSVALTMILRDECNLQPQAALGYSMGESTMLWALGVWTDTVAGHAALHDTPLFRTRLTGLQEAVRAAWELPPATDAAAPAIWASYVLAAPAAAVQAQLADLPRVYLTHINSPKEVVISGDPAGCREVIGRLRCAHLPVPVSIAIHAPVTRSEYQAIVQMHHWAAHPVPGIRFYSGVQGAPLQLTTAAIATDIAEALCAPVDFPRLVNAAYADGARIFCELGPARTCTRWISAILQGQPHVAIATNQPGTNDATALVKALAALVSHRVPLDLALLGDTPAPAPARRPAVSQTVLVGGPRLRDILLAETAMAQFAHRRDLARMPHDAAPLPAPAPARLAAGSPATQAHLAFLGGQREALQHLSTLLRTQIAAGAPPIATPIATPLPPPAAPLVEPPPARADVIWDEADMLEFAAGSIARVFGDDYAIIDTYPRRVRLPMPPYLLVSRVTRLAATRGRYEPSAITTEFDIPPHGPYTVDGQALWAVTVESGQCDLLLISYLGIDFETKGERVYRLLDCALTFIGDLPQAGDTLRYDIRINSFARSGENLLFFFSYECYVGDTMILRLDRGCAGFFSDSELDEGKGIIVTAAEQEARARIVKHWFDPPHLCRKMAFTRDDLLALTEGRLDRCFGPAHQPARPNPSLRLPAPPLLMLDRITAVDPHGGAWGLGWLVAEQDLSPDLWFFPCHFRDDPVMAGSLMAEGCVQLMQFYLLYLGLHLPMVDARFQPVCNLQQKVRCRGQVTPGVADKLSYEVEITGITPGPTPEARANINVIFNGKTIVSFENLGLRLAEKQGKPVAALAQGAPVQAGPVAGSSHCSAHPPLLRAEQWGDPAFRAAHGLTYAYMAGAMANGIASEDMVIALGQAGMLGSFGAAGLMPARIEAAIHRIQQALPHGPYAFNLIHSPSEEALERRATDLYLQHGITTVEASAFMALTPQIVRYRAAGLSLDPQGQILIRNRVIAKISRREVATHFLQPAPAAILQALVAQNAISELQARLAAHVPMADDLTVEADSGGHTDNRPLICLLPSIIELRDAIQAQYQFPQPVRVGAAGGISTPAAVLAAFLMGAAYVVTGSINQACVEAGTSPHTRRLLAQAGMADVMMAPAADMFEAGVKVQVLKKGSLFPMRALKLYELYQAYDSLEAIPAVERAKLERQVFQQSLDSVWAETVAFFQERDPEQIRRALDNPKRKMALVFRWYLGLASRWSNTGDPRRVLDYQIWCGPAMGAFNDWARGSALEDPDQRHVAAVGLRLLVEATTLYRRQQLRLQGLDI